MAKLMTIDLMNGPEKPIVYTNLTQWKKIKKIVNVLPFVWLTGQVQFMFKDEVPDV